MATGNEKKALQAIYEAGGETTSHTVSQKLGIDTGYARSLCMNLSQKNYVDLQRAGRFRITYKGKSALGKVPGLVAMGKDQGVPFKRLSQERLGWGVIANSSSYRVIRSFDKPGQEEMIWSTAEVDRSGKNFYKLSGGMRTVKLLTETSYACGFCQGKGKKQKVATCFVCRGIGKVSVNPPAVICAYCKGEGEEKPRSNMTCSVCRGKGVVSIREPAESCTYCRGTGRAPHSKLSCLKCRGKGVVTKPELQRTTL